MSASLRLSFAKTRQLLRGERSVITRRTLGRRSASLWRLAFSSRAPPISSSLSHTITTPTTSILTSTRMVYWVLQQSTLYAHRTNGLGPPQWSKRTDW